MLRKISILAVATMMSIGAIGTPALADDHKRLVILQDAPVLADHHDPDFKPNETGAVLFFGADLRSTKGKKVGELIGQITTFDVRLDGVDEEDRFRELVFNMKGGQIVALGASQYARTEVPNFADNNAPVTIAIVGGTGDYAGVRGTVTTKKRANGTYKHTFTFMD